MGQSNEINVRAGDGGADGSPGGSISIRAGDGSPSGAPGGGIHIGHVTQTVDAPVDDRPREHAPEPRSREELAVVLFVDIVDSTALTEQMGDSAFREKARDLDSRLRQVIRENNGTPIEGTLVGDGVLAMFKSAKQAIEAALECGVQGDICSLPVHLGVNAGDLIVENGNVYGGAVNLAARIAAASAPGEILVPDTVRELARTSTGVDFEERGEHLLKGCSKPTRLWVVRGDRASD